MYYIQCIRNELAICLNLLCFSLVSHVRTLHVVINSMISQISLDSICPSIHTSTPWLRSWLFISCPTETDGFPGGAVVKKATYQYMRHKSLEFDPQLGKIPWQRKWQPTLVFLLGTSHGQRNLLGISWTEEPVHGVARSRRWLSMHTHKWNWFPWLVFLTLVLFAKCSQKWLC